jgi:hypothetical protein
MCLADALIASGGAPYFCKKKEKKKESQKCGKINMSLFIALQFRAHLFVAKRLRDAVENSHLHPG